jgi:hypothetical protein
MVRPWFLGLLSFVAVTCGWSPSAMSEEFRIETEIFVTHESEPIAKNVTLFTDKRVYDFSLASSEEIAIFEPDEKTFTLIDLGREVQTRFTTRDLLTFLGELKLQAAGTGTLAQFAAEPRFEETFDRTDKILGLTGSHMVYEARGIEAINPESAQQYQRFADWYARLNSTRPGALPPYARLQLNRSLADKELIPVEVRLRFSLKPLESRREGETDEDVRARETNVRSRHRVNWGLLQIDRRRIDAANLMRKQYRLVSFDQYRGLDKLAARSTASGD